MANVSALDIAKVIFDDAHYTGGRSERPVHVFDADDPTNDTLALVTFIDRMDDDVPDRDVVLVGKATPERLAYLTKHVAEIHMLGDRFVIASGDVKKVGAVLSFEHREVGRMERRVIRTVSKKETDEERFILGVVLEPDSEDSQGDIYSAEEVRQACHWYMEHGRQHRLQHRRDITDKLCLLENFIAPCDMEIGEQTVKAGTWLMGVRVLDDDIWEMAKSGELTGFSIGGTAVRRPIDTQ